MVAWRKGELVFRVAIREKGDPRNPAAGDAYATPYSITLIVQPLRP